MSLRLIISEIVSDEGSVRLERGLALKWTSDKSGGTMSLSRHGDKPPSSEEIFIIIKSMEEILPPHSVDIDQMVYQVKGHQVVRLYLYWENENG